MANWFFIINLALAGFYVGLAHITKDRFLVVFWWIAASVFIGLAILYLLGRL